MFFKLLPIYVFKAAYQKMCLFQSIFKVAERYHEKDSWFWKEKKNKNWTTVPKPQANICMN